MFPGIRYLCVVPSLLFARPCCQWAFLYLLPLFIYFSFCDHCLLSFFCLSLNSLLAVSLGPSSLLPYVLFFFLSEMLNALLMSSFYSTGFNNFQFYSTGFNNFQFYSTGFNNFQFYSTGFNNFQFYSTGFNTTLSFDLGLPFLCPFFSGPFYKKCTCYTCNTSSAFSLYLCNLLCNFVPF